MNIPNLIKSLEIFSKYTIKPDASWISAEHDQIYVEAMDKLIGEEDLRTLVDMGWFQDADDDFQVILERQSLEDSWTCYV